MSTFIESAGWTLLHSLWQGTLVWIGLRVALDIMRRRSAQARYLVSCAALGLAVILPGATFLRLGLNARPSHPPAFMAQAGPPGLPKAPGEPVSARTTWAGRFNQVLVLASPWLVATWAVGCVVGLARLASAWGGVRRLVSVTIGELPADLEARCRRLQQRLELERTVRFGESLLVKVPSIVGWLKPTILWPVGAFSGLSPSQVEGILAHELAHIKRHDFVVNLLQSLCAVVFYYHPAIHGINRIIRDEREDACDDIAIACTGDAPGYAAALLRLEETRQLTLMIGATGAGGLLHRVRRLMTGDFERRSYFPAGIGVILAGVGVCLTVVFAIPAIAVRVVGAEPTLPPASTPDSSTGTATSAKNGQSVPFVPGTIRNLTIASDGHTTGTITAVSGPVTKNNSGTLTLSGVNSYPGPTTAFAPPLAGKWIFEWGALPIMGTTVRSGTLSLAQTPAVPPLPFILKEDYLAEDIARNFGGDRRKFLAHLRAEGKTLREYRIVLESQHPPDSVQQPPEPQSREEEVHLRLIQLSRAEQETDEALLQTAHRILTRLKGGESFSDLAKKHSHDLRRSRGGDWGWQKRSDFRKEFSEPAFQLKNGESSEPILLPAGCFILHVEDRR